MYHRLSVLLLLSCAAAADVAAVAQEHPAALQEHLAAAREAQAKADCHLAAQEYHAAVQLLPGSGELRTNEGIALFCDDQLEAAVTSLHAALHLNPSLTTPHLFLGLASSRLARLDTANQELTLYLKHAPKDVTAHLWLGYTLAAQNRHADANAQFTQVLNLDPENLDARYAFGQSACELARSKARALQAVDPTGVKLLQLAAEQYRAQGDNEHADAAAAEAARRSRASPGALESARATQLANEARVFEAQALAAFQSIVTTAPDSYRAHEVLGDALLALHQDPAAIVEYQTVIRLNPRLAGVHEVLSECLVSTGRFAEALAALNAERALSPVPSSLLLTRIGQAQHAMGRNEEAAESLQRATAARDAPPQAFLLLAQVQLAQRNATATVALLQHFLKLRPDSSTAYYDLSRAYRILDNRPAMAQALANYKRTSQDEKARALMAPLTQDAPGASFPDNVPDTAVGMQPVQNP